MSRNHRGSIERGGHMRRRLSAAAGFLVFGLALGLAGPARAQSVTAQYRTAQAGAQGNQIGPILALVNRGTAATALSSVTVRYWFTADGTQSLNSFCDWAQVSCTNITARFVRLATPTSTADTYVELAFGAGAGSLAAGQSSGDIQLRVAKSDWSNFNQANDHSWDGTKTALADWDRVTVYVSGALVWGVEPGGSPPPIDATPPTAAAALAASSVTSSSLTLCWTAATDNVGITGYTVTLSGAIVASTTSTCASVTGLMASTTYTFTVTARDAAGNTSASAPLSVMTASGPSVCTVSPVPSFPSLPTNAKLPDPFKTLAGPRISRKDEWSCRRAEVGALVQQFELGAKPDEPTVTAAFTGNTLTVTVAVNGRSISFNASITYPSTGTAPFPAVIGVGGSFLDNAALSRLGVAVINFPNDDIAQQVNAGSRGQGKFYTLYGAGHTAGALMAWAWGVSRLIDALEDTPAARIDPARLGVTGCSRNGKGALMVGAFDERIALTIPQESGSGGAASWRVSQAQLASGTMVQTLSEIVGENVWFTSSFSQFGNAVNKLPFDHHDVAGLVAPRGLLIIENTSFDWLGNRSTFTNAAAAHLIWEALGVPDNMGFSQLGNHNHCAFPAAQQPEVSAFVTRFLLDGSANTTVFKTDGGFTFDRATWVDWSVPVLQ
jgi:hypothetical protein